MGSKERKGELALTGALSLDPVTVDLRPPPPNVNSRRERNSMEKMVAGARPASWLPLSWMDALNLKHLAAVAD